MKLEAVRDIIKYRADSVRKITEIIRGQQNELVQANAILESIDELISGKEVSAFMLSFPLVRNVSDIVYQLEQFQSPQEK